MEWPNKYSNIVRNDNCVAWKHGHIVATEMSRAQLWSKDYATCPDKLIKSCNKQRPVSLPMPMRHLRVTHFFT